MLVFCDSFDHYATADLVAKWTSQSSATGQSVNASGRRSTSAWRNTAATTLFKAVASLATYVCGMAYQISSLPAAVSTILEFDEGATTHVALRLNADGSLTVARNTTALGTSAAGVITSGTFYYIELKATINNATGAYDVQVNGANVLSGSGADTQNGGTAAITLIGISGVTARTTDIDDFYICDTTGSVNNNFLGDRRVDCYFPSGNGNSSVLVGSDADSVNNYLLVDEAAPNGDTDYVQSASAGDKDTYAISNMAHTPASFNGTQTCASAKKDDAGARSLATVCRSGGADYDGATQALSTGYLYYLQIRETDPATAAAWTKTGFDAAEFGVKVAA